MRGFTLIEAMVALAIVALGMIAVFMQLGRYAESAVHIEDKTIASWIATNRITELSVASTWPALGKDQDDVDFGGRMWHVRVEVKKTPVDNLRRVNVAVSLTDSPDAVIDKVSGFIEPPVPPGFGQVHWLTAGRAQPGPQGTRK